MIPVRRIVISTITILVLVVVVRYNAFVLQDSPQFCMKEYSESGDGTIHAYLINLDKSEDRLAKITPKLHQLGINFTRIPGVYGKALGDDEKNRLTDRSKYLRFMHNHIGDGTIGCYLSHVKVWESFVESDYSYAVVFEDDASFVPDELRRAIDNLTECKDEWDIVTFDYIHYGHPRKIRDLDSETASSLVKFRTRVGNAGCYLINRKAAIRLLQKSLPIMMPVDHYYVRSWEFGLKFTGVTPQIVHQDSATSIRMQMDNQSSVSIKYKILSTIHQIFSQIMTCMSAY
ncbi:MAG: glycosyltransferase family 25 protein [Holosporales bacterium]|jgi:glycosyl transferase family 25|nr:glycosyltransferase family 25 protein [Holosporales bacterium]